MADPNTWFVAQRAACLLLCGGLIAGSSGVTGCARSDYRQQADAEAYSLVAEKYTDPRWAMANYTIELDPASRYFDPYDPDAPPLPPDDPTAHTYMHCVDGMKGWKRWHDSGDRFELENPSWRDGLAEIAILNERGEYVLDLETSLELAYTHAPSYQQQLETLYLSALDVSTERFRLDTQFFGGVNNTYTHNGDTSSPALRFNNAQGRYEFIPGTQNSALEQNRLTTNSQLEARRSFATAGQLLVGFANSFVWEFTGGDANFTSSLFNYTLVQPLLRGAGRDIALERLTRVERGLLGNLRAMQRYRHGLYTNVSVGQLGVQGPSRQGGFQGGTGLTGFSGTGAGGLGGVGGATGFGRGGFGGGGVGGGAAGAGLAGGGAGTVGGYIGLLQQLQQIRNTEASLTLQVRTLNLLEAYLDAGVIDLVQVDQFRQSIETERAVLLQDNNSLANDRETFLTGTLGLPPDLPITLDDTLIQQFQFIDPQATNLQNAIGDLQDALGVLPQENGIEALTGMITQAGEFAEATSRQLDTISRDLDRMEDNSHFRVQAMEAEEVSLFQREKELLHENLVELRESLAELEPQLGTLSQGLSENARDATIGSLVIWINDLYRLVQVSILIQARARLETVVVEPITLQSDEAFQIALQNRLDLMNNRAALVDSWRLIAFNADALQSQLDVVVRGNTGTTRNNPFSFDDSTSRLTVGLEFDAPFTRLLERNNYRQQLIEYQQDRRQFIQIRDGINQSLRALLRLLEQLRLNLEIQRRAVAISIRRVDLTREELNEPVPPPEPGQPAAQFGPTAALNLLGALSDLRSTQNNFMSVWLNYYANRMVLVRDLGIMVVDEEGRWIDQSLPDAGILYEGEGDEMLPPPPIPTDFYDVVRLVEPGDADSTPPPVVSTPVSYQQ